MNKSLKRIHKTGHIYRGVFPNGKCYVGKSINDFGSRPKDHERAAKAQSESLISRAIRKHGTPRWEIIVDDVPEIFLNSFEKYWIHHYSSFGNGYNMTIGGDGGILYSWTQEQRDAQRNRQLGMPSPAKGYRWSQEQRGNLSTLMTGKGNGFHGKTHSKAQKEMWSKLRKGKVWSQGWNHSDESKKLMSDKAKETITCIFCCFTSNTSNITRYHNDNCPLKVGGKYVGMRSNASDKNKYMMCEVCEEYFIKGRAFSYHKNRCKGKND